MRVAIRHLAGHLVWSTAGPVWAIWRLDPGGSRYMGAQQRTELHGRLTTLVRSLPEAARLYGLCAQVDAGEVIARTVEGVDLDAQPQWAQTARAQLELLDGLEMHQRTLWLAVPLQTPGWREQVTAASGGVWAELSGMLGLRPAPVGAAEVVEYRQRAARIEAELAASVSLRPARPAEIVWMHQHAVHRGLPEPLLLEAAGSDAYGGQLFAGRLRCPSYQDLGLVRLLEGGQQHEGQDAGGADGASGTGRRTARKRGGPRKRSVFQRVWLEVESEAGTGYQAHLPLTEMPRAQRAETADLLAQLEDLPFPVDFCVDMRLVPAEKLAEEVRKKKRDLTDQAEQYAAQSATGLPEGMHAAAKDLGELDSRTSESSVEVEVQAVTVLTVWGPDAATCDERAQVLAKQLRGANYRLARPSGEQEELLTLSLPGAATPPRARQYTQHQLGEDWAMCGALQTSAWGDERGHMVGVSQDTGTIRPVLLDIANAPQATASASFGISGELGGGKSVLLKLIDSAVVDRGGRSIVIDRTPVREWAHFARAAAPGRVQIVDAARAERSIDPLRIFDAATGAHYALSYLTLQLGIGPLTAQGALLKAAINSAQTSERPSMAAVVAALEDVTEAGGARGQEAGMLHDLLRMIAEEPLAASVFDPDLPPISLEGDLGADWVVLTTAGLTLPPREAVTNPELMRAQPTEALIGRAVLYLIAALSRQVAFSDPQRFCLIAADECYWLTSSAEGTALVTEVVHDGRKHNAGIGLSGHSVEDLGPKELRGLLAYRFLTRTTDEALARGGLEFLGLSPEDEGLLRIVTTQLSPIGNAARAGEVLARDPRMRVGRFQSVVPPRPELEKAIFTSPGDLPSSPGPGSDSAAAIESGGRGDRPGLYAGETAGEPGGAVPPHGPPQLVKPPPETTSSTGRR
ncbi:ATP-binding protein [Streptomyces nanshensis]|uniref:ATP-binding protein n=1 Tax=Streptomyces nanshensis TaxID=518642 RepID=UPI00085CB7D8|nr:ATP-binding protein [Streptomyces nanshensis]